MVIIGAVESKMCVFAQSTTTPLLKKVIERIIK